MLSDTLLALNRFVLPLPLAELWILATYYAAQMFIVAGVLRGWAALSHPEDQPGPAH